MSIEFNTLDYNLRKISRKSKLGNLETDANYRIYGLVKTNNPAVLVECNFEEFGNFDSKRLVKFFRSNGLNLEFSDLDGEGKEKTIYIGLRTDLRDNIVLCACILQTIIYYLDGRLELRDYKIVGIPRLL